MPYSISQSELGCDGYAVVKDGDGEVMGCHDTESEAQDQIAAIEASEADRTMETAEEVVQDVAGSHRTFVQPQEVRFSSDEVRTTVAFMANELARDGVVLRADGLSTQNYLRNPVVLWDHGQDPRRGSEPIATTKSIERNGNGAYVATLEWEDDEFAQRIRAKVKKGTIRAVSLGWHTPEGAVERQEINGAMRPVITRSDMTEFSFVGVGSDPDALVLKRDADSQVRRLEQKVDQLTDAVNRLTGRAQIAEPPAPKAQPEQEDDTQDETEHDTGASATADAAPEDSGDSATAEASASTVPDASPTEEDGSASDERDLVRVSMDDLKALKRQIAKQKRAKAQQLAKQRMGIA